MERTRASKIFTYPSMISRIQMLIGKNRMRKKVELIKAWYPWMRIGM